MNLNRRTNGFKLEFLQNVSSIDTNIMNYSLQSLVNALM